MRLPLILDRGLWLFMAIGIIYAFCISDTVFIGGLIFCISLTGLAFVRYRLKVRNPLFYALAGFFIGLFIFSILGYEAIAFFYSRVFIWR